MDEAPLENILESLLLVSDEPLTTARAAEVLERPEAEIIRALDSLARQLKADERGIQIRKISGGFRLYTHPAYAHYVEQLVKSWDTRRLTQAALETLSIVAYKQPVTKVSVSAIRGVNADAAVASLLAKGLIKEAGREKSPGSPILYGTSKLFLEKLGLNSIRDLPALADFEPDASVRAEIEAGLGVAAEEEGDPVTMTEP